MLESLTPGLVLILSACTSLLFLGLVISFHNYFSPYLRRQANPVLPLLPQATQAPIDPELQQSLYSLPSLLHHLPRSSLAQCEIQSSRWSTNLLSTSGPPSPITPTQLGTVLLLPRRHQARYSSSANLSALRQSLYSGPGLLLSPLSDSCSTFVPDDEDHFPSRRARSASIHQSPDMEEHRRCIRRYSAPILTILSQSSTANDDLPSTVADRTAGLKVQTLSPPPTYSKHTRSRERSFWTADELQQITSKHKSKSCASQHSIARSGIVSTY